MCDCTHTPTPTAPAAVHRHPGRRTGKRVGVVFGTAVLMLGGGVAFAAWTHNGTGSANAQATTATALVVAPGTPAGTLYPEPTGGYADPMIGAIYTTVTNPNSYPVKVTTVSIGAVGITPQPGRTCATGSVVATSGTPVALATPITLAAGATATAVTIPNAVRMIPTAEDGCQGAGFSAAITLTGVSA